MAIDTAAKRASALAFCLPIILVLPIPDGTVAQADRQHLLGCYGGILAGESEDGTVEGAEGSTRLAMTVTVGARKARTVTTGACHVMTVTVGARS